MGDSTWNGEREACGEHYSMGRTGNVIEAQCACEARKDRHICPAYRSLQQQRTTTPAACSCEAFNHKIV